MQVRSQLHARILIIACASQISKCSLLNRAHPYLCRPCSILEVHLEAPFMEMMSFKDPFISSHNKASKNERKRMTKNLCS